LAAVKVTGPVKVTVGEVILAVNVTACPRVDGFADDVMVAALVVCFTTWVSTGEELLRLNASPKYTAAIG
jgi:hypothetical protein